MKAVRLTAAARPLENREIPVPPVGATDILVRVKAAGICHSDAHYRAGRSPVHPLPMTLGHEVAGVVEQTGHAVTRFKAGDRVCLHYMATCGECGYCKQGNEQFCPTGAMIGKHRDGGYAEYIAVPERSAFRLPDQISFEHGAVMMCSSATSFHAVRKARLQPGESVAIFGFGGLGISALQIAGAFGAGPVYTVDIDPAKLELAAKLGAVPVNARATEPVNEIKRLTNGRGVDVAVELIGLPVTLEQAIQSLAILGRAAVVGICEKPISFAPYTELLNKEAEIIGVSDHLATELPGLLELACQRKLDLSHAVTRVIALDADAINETLDRLDRFCEAGRVVIVPDMERGAGIRGGQLRSPNQTSRI